MKEKIIFNGEKEKNEDFKKLKRPESINIEEKKDEKGSPRDMKEMDNI